MLDFIGQALIYVVPFLLVLTLVVTIHELGHFWVARAFGVKVDRFSIGFGKGVLSRTDRHGIEWRLGWIPLGGYVKFAGDADPSSVPDSRGLEAMRQDIAAHDGQGAEKDYFHFKPVWQRALIVAAGPFANFVLAVTIFTLLFSLIGAEMRPPRIVNVVPDSAAAEAGFQPGDLILRVNGRLVEDDVSVQRMVTLSAGDPLDFVVRRGEQEVALTATPRRIETQNPIAGPVRMGVLGVEMRPMPGEATHRRYPPHEAVWQGMRETWSVLETTVTYLGRIVTGRESGDQLSGPLGIAKASGALTNAAADVEASNGIRLANVLLTLISFAAILSIGIGFLNLLPIPVLDGGHLLFYGYEAVARRPLAANIQEMGYRVGLVLLVGLMLFATWNDLRKLSLFQFLGGLSS